MCADCPGMERHYPGSLTTLKDSPYHYARVGNIDALSAIICLFFSHTKKQKGGYLKVFENWDDPLLLRNTCFSC